MSENLDLVRSIYADWERGDYYSSTAWAHPEIEFVRADGPAPGSWTGLAEMESAWRDVLGAWDKHRSEAEDYRDLHDGRVLVLSRNSARGKASEAEIATDVAIVFHISDGKVARLVLYWDRGRALADLGLEG
jgi:ketosteroid isomerase-like protein